MNMFEATEKEKKSAFEAVVFELLKQTMSLVFTKFLKEVLSYSVTLPSMRLSQPSQL